MKDLKLDPGPKIGALLDCLLAQVIENPDLNNKDYLLQRAKELAEDSLEELRIKAKELISEKREEEDTKLKNNFYVK
jgi:poly(A) polymerase/tRNA nucleotidyltransferase (CCA-adding enzyme)